MKFVEPVTKVKSKLYELQCVHCIVRRPLLLQQVAGVAL